MSAAPVSRRSERTTIVLITFLLGLALGIFQSIVWLVSEPLVSGVTSSPSFVAFLLLVAPLVWAIAFFCQGIRVGYRTGRLSQGAMTGIFSGIFGGLTAAVGHVLVITLSLHGSDQDPIATAYATLGVATWTMILTVGAGGIFGVLGGFVGQYCSPVPPVGASSSPVPPVPPPFSRPNQPPSALPYPPGSPSGASPLPSSQKPQTGGGPTPPALEKALWNTSERVFNS